MFDALLHQLTYHAREPMLFNTGLFLFFFLLLLFFYQFVYQRPRSRITYLTLVSLYFYYKSGGFFFGLLILSTIVDFYIAGLIFKSNNRRKRTGLLMLSLVVNLGLLAYFKYTNFFVDIVSGLRGGHANPLDIALPVGISFYTFQVLSYTIDIYRGLLKPAKSIFDFAFYIMFFPHLVAGPIVRAVNFLPQIHQKVWLSRQDLGTALFLIVTGLFKKAVISDYISTNFVDRVFENPVLYSGWENLMAVYGYAMQIYCDFSGYSDMAIGIALLMGYRLGINFNQPYQSASITEFWKRWHISLSSWLRDYLYIPLGGSRAGSRGARVIIYGALLATWLMGVVLAVQQDHYFILLIAAVATLLIFIPSLFSREKRQPLNTSLNLMSTMLLGGLWHGASWNFIFWGFLHGAALGIEKFIKTWVRLPDARWVKVLGVLLTFHFVCFCWIFFRAGDFHIATQVLEQIANAFDPVIIGQWMQGYLLVFALILFGYLTHFIPVSWNARLERKLAYAPMAAQIFLLAGVVYLVIQMKSADIQPFIYFRF